jgi:hypothetical protein
MTLSPELESKFEKLLASYPPGRQRSAVVPMLLFGQDEVGSVTQELIEEVARRTGITPLQVEEVVTYYSMLHRKPIGLLDTLGDWDPLVRLLDHATQQRFIRDDHRALLLSAEDPDALLDAMTAWRPPAGNGWLRSDEET